jgi:hypothetical protein
MGRHLDEFIGPLSFVMQQSACNWLDLLHLRRAGSGTSTELVSLPLCFNVVVEGDFHVFRSLGAWAVVLSTRQSAQLLHRPFAPFAGATYLKIYLRVFLGSKELRTLNRPDCMRWKFSGISHAGRLETVMTHDHEQKDAWIQVHLCGIASFVFGHPWFASKFMCIIHLPRVAPCEYRSLHKVPDQSDDFYTESACASTSNA